MKKPIYIEDLIRDRELLKKLKIASPEDGAAEREAKYWEGLSKLVEEHPIVGGHARLGH